MLRLPCLATGIPAPASTNAAAVETLSEPEPSPPVPQGSSKDKSRETRSALDRIPSASPAISSNVSPFIRSAVKNAPTWEGVASPDIRSSIDASASSRVRDPPSTSFAIASLINVHLPLLTGVQEIVQQLLPGGRQNRFGMKLDTLNLQLL